MLNTLVGATDFIMAENYDNNGRHRWAAGIVAAIALTAIAWNFSAVQSLQVQNGGNELRIAALRSDFEAQRQVDTNFQTEIRTSISQSQSEMRVAIAHVADLITEIRVKIGASPTPTARK